ncbi:MAG: DEAD/DEAH box helicase family protein [Caldilineaceae bacterium]|nr:DEAD/DEAH box helicase family protein [Caldilineaceae bacterium]
MKNASQMVSLVAALSDIAPVYEIPDDDLIGEVLVPAISHADEVWVGSGYFSSCCLAQVAPGLADFIKSSEAPLKLLISPEISSEDWAAIKKGVTTEQDLVDQLATDIFGNDDLSESALAEHTRECFAYLIAARRLELRFVLMESGIYHKKQWLIRDDEVWVAVHGSGNATSRGLLVNGEQMTVDRAWADGPAAKQRVEKLIAQWQRQWDNEHPRSLTLSASAGLQFAGRGSEPSRIPTVGDFWRAWRCDHAAGLEPDLPSSAPLPQRTLLEIPLGLEWRTGRYAHQGEAVDAFFHAGGRGILAIATGGGKTRAALIAIVEAQHQYTGSMLVVVLVPSRPLMQQWADDIRNFGISPTLPSTVHRTKRRKQLQEIEVALRSGTARTEIMVVTNSLFAQDSDIRGLLDHLSSAVRVFLIGDEMHNLGAPLVFDALPTRANLRLGLSATPIRQYDPDGTDKLFKYFGPPVYEFGLADAIRTGCLTPYEYHLHEAPMSDWELDKWTELTEELRKAGFTVDEDGRSVVPSAKAKHLLIERRAVLEQVSSKIGLLSELLLGMGPSSIRRCLIYTSAKRPVLDQARQIEQVNQILAELEIISHQFTSAETTYRDARNWLEAFERGDYQVLTAMKVLDEGIDIPQTDTAFLLASSAVQREWVQRRGRILRRAPDKILARLHDFIVVPPNSESSAGQAILKSELRRAEAFARLAENEWDNNGPRSIMSRYESLVWARR